MLQTATSTAFGAKELEDFFNLLPRIYADYRDPRRGPFELVYVFSETSDNEDSCFLRAVEMGRSRKMRVLGVGEGDKGHGYEGFDHSVARLKALGWTGVVPVEKFDTHGNVNTLFEARLLAQYAKGRKGDIGIIAPPFHLVRAFMTTVSALREADAVARVYAICGVPVPWGEKVAHSQGTLVNTRAGLLGDELMRLKKYQAPEFGSLISAAEVIQYLDWRDS